MIRTVAFLFFTLSFSGAIPAQLFIDAETGMAFNTSNTVQFPNESNSVSDRINVTDVFENGDTWYYRLRLGYTIADRHTISVLYAPLEFSYDGRFSRPLVFGDNTFAGDEDVDLNYQFNSYRLTYRYEWINEGKFRFGIGLTAKIRDARIKVESEGATSETEDFGFVPLINLRAAYHFNDDWSVLLRGDALVGEQGRAEDAFLGAVYTLSDSHLFKLGYRILDGGADVDQVYNFALVHYAAVAYQFRIEL
ncbi:MAG TPA: hypothetical protein VJ894_01100 [Cryomorphaceae bacterium]|nr:hypothetical protein [Cryomorphaceae bacterium]